MAVELNTEATTLQRIKSGKLVEGLEHMSPTYLEGIKRMLTVSADTELISAPASSRAAQDAPFPARFDATTRRWAFDEGPIGWDQVLKRWKARGPMNEEYVASLQRRRASDGA